MIFTRAFGALAARRNYIGRPEVIETDKTKTQDEAQVLSMEYADNAAA